MVMLGAMRMWSLVSLFLVACGGAPRGTSAAHPAAPAESKNVLELRASADTVCHCPDDGCAQPALEQLLAREAELQNPIDQVALDTEHDRAIDCYARIAQVPTAAELVPVMEHAADQVCACADEACARAVVESLRTALAAKENAVFTTRAQAALEAAGDRLQKCAARFSATP
jgi:hypothetical protein